MEQKLNIILQVMETMIRSHERQAKEMLEKESRTMQFFHEGIALGYRNSKDLLEQLVRELEEQGECMRNN